MIEQFKQRHENYLRQLVDNLDIPAPLLCKALYYNIFPGGKRIRPLLVYLFGQLLEIDLKVLDVIAGAIELTHSYSLIHDDLPAMDNDNLRRGKPSCHRAFDEATAILVGDGLQALAFQILLEGLTPLIDKTQAIAVSIELMKASGLSGMISGQSLDLIELKNPEITEEELCKIHQLKTGRLISACAEMVLASQAFVDENASRALRTFTHHIGLVFQMQDDYLDHYTSSTHLGKNRSSDMVNQKTTFASLFPKNQLEDKINNYYQMALTALEHFGHKGSTLIAITKELQNRS